MSGYWVSESAHMAYMSIIVECQALDVNFRCLAIFVLRRSMSFRIAIRHALDGLKGVGIDNLFSRMAFCGGDARISND